MVEGDLLGIELRQILLRLAGWAKYRLVQKMVFPILVGTWSNAAEEEEKCCLRQGEPDPQTRSRCTWTLGERCCDDKLSYKNVCINRAWNGTFLLSTIRMEYPLSHHDTTHALACGVVINLKTSVQHSHAPLHQSQSDTQQLVQALR